MDQNWTLSPLEGGRDRELRWSTSPSVNSRTLRMGNLMPNPALCINDFVFSSSSLRACPGITITSQLRFKWLRPCLQKTSSLFIVGFLITLSGLPPALYPKYIAFFYLVKPSWKNESVNGGHIISHNVPSSTCIFKSHVQQVLTHVWEGNYDNIPPYMSKNLPYHYYLTCLDHCCPFNISLLNPVVGLYAR